MKFLSIIIPCYNAAKTIQSTLDCLVREIGSLCSYEIVVVNDGSTDRSAEVVEAMALQNPNILLFNKQNGGVSDARNYGLKKANGEYIWFFDADDLCFNGAVRVLIGFIRNNNPDIINFWSYTVDSYSRKAIDRYNNNNDSKILFNGKLKDALNNKRVPFACWSNIVRRRLLNDNNVRFKTNLHISEDTAWNIDIALKCPEAHYVATNLRVVKYMVHTGSIVNSVNSKTAEKQLVSYLDYAKFLQSLSHVCPYYLSVAIENQRTTAGKKLITRLLSAKTGFRDSREYIDKISALNIVKNGGGGIFQLMAKIPAVIPFLQLLYRNLFLRVVKPLIARN